LFNSQHSRNYYKQNKFYIIFNSSIHTKYYSESLKEREELGDLDIGVMTILKWILKKWKFRYSLDTSEDGSGLDTASFVECLTAVVHYIPQEKIKSVNQ